MPEKSAVRHTLSERQAQQLANVTKTAPMMTEITPRWLVPFLQWVPVEAGTYRVNKVVPATHTTPDAIQLNQLLRQMADEGCTHVFMETSSHAIHQHRIAGLFYTGGVFSNITHDHLDYHETFDEYIRVKKSFFDSLSASAFAISNAVGDTWLSTGPALASGFRIVRLAKLLDG